MIGIVIAGGVAAGAGLLWWRDRRQPKMGDWVLLPSEVIGVSGVHVAMIVDHNASSGMFGGYPVSMVNNAGQAIPTGILLVSGLYPVNQIQSLRRPQAGAIMLPNGSYDKQTVII